MARKATKSLPKEPQLERSYDEWIELCKWLEVNIFNYTPPQKLQTAACLILDGLRKGQDVANSIIPTNGQYPVVVLLMTFQIYKNTILNAISNKDFETEAAKMKYICVIARNHINDVYSRYMNAQKTQEKTLEVNIEERLNHETAGYQSTTKEVNKKFEELW